MNQTPSMERLFDSGSHEEDLYSSALQWETPDFFILKRAIVISVKMGVNTSEASSAFLPQYSINARVIGEGISTKIPENDIPQWYTPLISNSIISVPEIGEQILIIHETLKSNSKGFWIGRVNDSDKVSLKLTNEQKQPANPLPLSRYGKSFDVKSLNQRSKQRNSYVEGKKIFQLPGQLGDVIIQGRSGSYTRHSFNPASESGEKPGLLEMGILQSRPYAPSINPTIGVSHTKTAHFSNSVVSALGSQFTKQTPNDGDNISQTLPSQYSGGPETTNMSENRKDFIVNIANEIYNVSNTTDSETSMYRQVLGEKLKEYFVDQDEITRGMLESIKGFVNTVDLLFSSYVDHTHTIPEINVNIPDKEVSFNDRINLGIKMEPQPPINVYLEGTTVQIPGTGSRTVSRTVRTPMGPKIVSEEVAGIPGRAVEIPSRFVSVPQPDKAVNRGYITSKRTKKIEYDKISIGGVSNPRSTTTIETDRTTDRVQNDLNDLKDSFDAAKDGFISLIKRFDNVYSQRHYIN
tara:strand:+ start:2770 stop:4332 length:1563 start_codon:yes stop_codon:yes gene_type:complete